MQPTARARRNRRNAACDECKRRKIRCAAEPQGCSQCERDGKTCTYSSPSHRLSGLQQSNNEYRKLLATITQAWSVHVPHVSLEQAISGSASSAIAEDTHASNQESVRQSDDSLISRLIPSEASDESTSDRTTPIVPEQSNAEDYEFDESQGFGSAIDGMGFLTVDASKAGYTGPQSNIAALRVLRSLPSGYQIDEPIDTPTFSTNESIPDVVPVSASDIDLYINDYFAYYHTAYPVLHEGMFRARRAGAVAKPRDGSWNLLLNIVIAMGAFVGNAEKSGLDWQFYQNARSGISLSVIEKGSLCYVQGLTIMSDYLQKRNKPNAGFSMIGIAWSMALAIGLHREFAAFSTTPYTMEMRRRTWWTLFVFVSGAQLALGRPPASLIGVNLRLPTNIDDENLTVDLTELPNAQEGPTVASCLIAQIKLTQIANAVQAELLSNRAPSLQRADKLRRSIRAWQTDLPKCFDAEEAVPDWFEFPRRVLLWRAMHLQIIHDRPSLFRAVAQEFDLRTCTGGPIKECIRTADACVESICQFLDEKNGWPRGFAWYAAYWLVSASFVHATCFAYTPAGDEKDRHATYLKQSINALQKLASDHNMASRAQKVLETLLGSPNQPNAASSISAQTQANWYPAFGADINLVDFTIDYLGLRSQSLQGAETNPVFSQPVNTDIDFWLQGDIDNLPTHSGVTDQLRHMP